MGKRYLNDTEEQVFSIYEQDYNSTRYIGRIVVGEYICLVMKDQDKIALTWDDIDLINSVRPVARKES